jgi:hypothetical protein
VWLTAPRLMHRPYPRRRPWSRHAPRGRARVPTGSSTLARAGGEYGPGRPSSHVFFYRHIVVPGHPRGVDTPALRRRITGASQSTSPNRRCPRRRASCTSTATWITFGFAVVDLDGPRMRVRYIDESGREHWSTEHE